jgi:hypothetical protein
MLTLFTIPKPFRGHIGIIQRNAIQSWIRLRPECEIILFGNDEGTAEVASEFCIRHIPEIARNEYGTPLLNSLFEIAQRSASHNLMAYVNADIILMSDFLAAVKHMPKSSCLMVGQRWDFDLQEELDFNEADWEMQLRARVIETARLHGHTGIDYFVFHRGFWQDIPPFAIGRTVWDNWLIYLARSLSVPVIDATATVTAIHQNHDYTHNPQGVDGVWKGPEAQRNQELAGGYSHVFTLQDANRIITAHGLKRQKMTSERLKRYFDTLPVLSPRTAPYAPYLRLVNLLLSPRSVVGAVKQKLHKFL